MPVVRHSFVSFPTASRLPENKHLMVKLLLSSQLPTPNKKLPPLSPLIIPALTNPHEAFAKPSEMVELAVALAPADPSFFLSAPSSPRPFGDPAGCYYYTSAPASPSRAAAIYTDLYGPEEKPASPRPGSGDDEVPEFSFCFHGKPVEEWPTLPITAADELFEEGIIRTVTPSWVENGGGGAPQIAEDGLRRERGRRTLSSFSGASPRGLRGSTSLSALRGGYEGDLPKPPSSSPATSALSKGGGSKKWKFSDLFLFRSASEGRATGRGSKDPLRKYTLPPPSSCTKRGANGGGSTRRGSASLPSAHEIYYSANRAAAEEQKRKQMTPLAYQRHGLFGYLSDNPAIHSITKGFGGSSLFSRRQR
ncbi:uncharacterized protein LOC103976691 [Musa acuminata AAA Group]|uniref:uncharacterized protein LOC103976691 n=2 Tax=Musa acuminata AAA Group TaxID=214697 RepID=UPI0031D5384A